MERTILHLTPAFEIDSDLYSTKSTEIYWNGRSTGRWPVVCCEFFFRRWDAWYSRHHLSTLRFIVDHQHVWRILSYVGPDARCPPDRAWSWYACNNSPIRALGNTSRWRNVLVLRRWPCGYDLNNNPLYWVVRHSWYRVFFRYGCICVKYVVRILSILWSLRFSQSFP